MCLAWAETLVQPTLLPLVSSCNPRPSNRPLAVRQCLACQGNAVNWKCDGRSLVHLNLESGTTILFDAEIVEPAVEADVVAAWQTCFGQLQAVRQGTELVGLQGVFHDFLTVRIDKGELQVCSFLCLWRFAVLPAVSKAAHIDCLSRTIDAAVGIDIDAMMEVFVLVVMIAPTQILLAESLVLASRKLNIQTTFVVVERSLNNASAVGSLFLELGVFLLCPIVEHNLDALLRFAAHRVRHHNAPFAVGHRDIHKGEGRNIELANNT